MTASMQGVIAVLSIGWMLVGLNPGLLAQTGSPDSDTVIVRKEGSRETQNRRGTIVEWKGPAMTIRINDRDREIENSLIVQVQTQWPAEYADAVSQEQAGRTTAATEKYQAALQVEQRPWARRIILARLVDCQMVLDRPNQAAQRFLEILQDDPHTRFLYLAPLPWAGSSRQFADATAWMNSSQPAQQLVGAAWLTSGDQQKAAVARLNELSRDLDPQIRSLATALLWRTRTDANPKQIAVWDDLLQQMPHEIRAGPHFLLAGFKVNATRVDEALLQWMQVVTIYEKQKSLAAASLFRAARGLQMQGKSEQANILEDELLTRYPETLWANEVRDARQ